MKSTNARSYSVSSRRNTSKKTVFALVAHCCISKLGAHIVMREIEKVFSATYFHLPEHQELKPSTLALYMPNKICYTCISNPTSTSTLDNQNSNPRTVARIPFISGPKKHISHSSTHSKTESTTPQPATQLRPHLGSRNILTFLAKDPSAQCRQSSEKSTTRA